MTDGQAILSLGAVAVSAVGCPACCRSLLMCVRPNQQADPQTRLNMESETASMSYMAAFFGVLGLICSLPFHAVNNGWCIVAYLGGVYFGTLLLGTLFAILSKIAIRSNQAIKEEQQERK